MTQEYIDKMIQDYAVMYGDESKKIIESMLEQPKKVALVNPFVKQSEIISQAKIADLGLSFIKNVEQEIKPFKIDGLLSHYFLDESSAMSASLLPIKRDDHVLDMCSSPGGKLLVMACKNTKAKFFANEISTDRFHRLRRNIQDFLPEEIRQNIFFTNKDAIFFGLKKPAHFDCVLLDAPCSSEAHVLRDEKLLKKYTGLRKNLSQKQYSLLAAALLTTKPSGNIMYATCSINKNENEGVIKKLLKKKLGQVEIAPMDTKAGLDTGYGMQFLPHLHNCGPAFFCLLKKSN